MVRPSGTGGKPCYSAKESQCRWGEHCTINYLGVIIQSEKREHWCDVLSFNNLLNADLRHLLSLQKKVLQVGVAYSHSEFGHIFNQLRTIEAVNRLF